MSGPILKSFEARLIIAVLKIPLYAAYGVFVMGRAVWRLVRFAMRSRPALAAELMCPNGHPNATTGRFECASCSATYHGWVGRCEVCGAGANWFPCDVCGVGIVIPWENR